MENYLSYFCRFESLENNNQSYKITIKMLMVTNISYGSNRNLCLTHTKNYVQYNTSKLKFRVFRRHLTKHLSVVNRLLKIRSH